jgi:hypothetical protein
MLKTKKFVNILRMETDKMKLKGIQHGNILLRLNKPRLRKNLSNKLNVPKYLKAINRRCKS